MVDAEEKKHCDDPRNSSTSLDIEGDDTSSSLDRSNRNHGVTSVASSTASASYYKSGQRRPPRIPKVTTPRRTSRGGVSSSSSSSGDESSRDDNNEEEEIQMPSYHNSRAAAKHRGRPNSSSDDRTSGDSTSTSYAADANPNGANPGVSPDQERQILLLMLLAQVCALHDPTPRTFTVHVLELFERGILGRQSIHFLFELGLVPSTAPRLLPPSTTGMESNGSGNDHVLDLATVSPTAPTSPQSLRTQEASVIRSHLEQHDLAQEAAAANILPAQGGFSSTALASSNDSPTKNKSSSWAVEHHPLSLSRYQREFHQVRLLNAGSFGEVFQATSKIDLRDYAVKRVAFSAWGYSKDSVTQVIREVHCLAQCDHPNVVRYYTSWLEPSWMTGSGATMITSTGSTSAEVRHQQKLLTDIQHMMITGGADALDQSQLQSQSQQSFESENNSSNNNKLQDFFFQRDRTSTRKFSIGSSLDSLDSAGSSYDETSSEEEEEDEDYGGSYSHPHWNASVHGDDPICSRDDSILFESHRREVWESSSSAPRRCKTQGNNTNKKQPAKLRYRYQICLFIQMQLCHPATLGDWIRNRNLQSADPDQDRHERVQTAIKIFSQIVSGLNHIHKKNIVHRDLKPANLFRSLEEDGVFLIGDFGLSKLIHSATHRGKHQHHYHASDGANNTVYHTPPEYPDAAASTWQDPLTAGVGTASYAANEQVTTRTYGKPADIFSLGLILLELVCCFCTEHERMQTFYDCRNRREVPSWITEEYPTIASTILACTNSDPQKRSTAEQLDAIDLLYVPPTEAGFDGSGESEQKEDPALLVAELRQELEAKNKLIQSYKEQLVGKDQTIEGLQQELALLKQKQNTTTTTTHIEYVNTTTSVTVEEVTSPSSNIDIKDANSK